MKRDKKQESVALDPYEDALVKTRARLSSGAAPNCMPYAAFVEHGRAAYAFRQYMHISLEDRLHTRPFLNTQDKLWITYQLMAAVQQAHSAGQTHGDIKPQNVLLTTYNWVMLTDFASHKPTYTQPGDFSFFFDSTGNGVCNLAPERFVDGKVSRDQSEPTKEMDLFALGCTIAELFTEGQPLFNLAQLLEYRKSGKGAHASHVLSKIENSGVTALIKELIAKDPKKRKSIDHHMSAASKKIFPSWFPTAHQYMVKFAAAKPEERFSTLTADLAPVMAGLKLPSTLASQPPPAPSAPPPSTSGKGPLTAPAPSISSKSGSTAGLAAALKAAAAGVDADTGAMLKDIERLIKVLDSEQTAAQKHGGTTRPLAGTWPPKPSHKTILEYTGGVAPAPSGSAALPPPPSPDGTTSPSYTSPSERVFTSRSPSSPGRPVPGGRRSNSKSSRGSRSSSTGSARSTGSNRSNKSRGSTGPSSSGTGDGSRKNKDLIIIAEALCTTLRSLPTPSSKESAMRYLASAITPHLEDEQILARVVPYYVIMLADPAPLVRLRAVDLLASILRRVKTVPVVEATIFPDYLLPALSRLIADREPVVRIAYASTVASFAETSKRFHNYVANHHSATPAPPAPAREKGSSRAREGAARPHNPEAELRKLHEAFDSVVDKLLGDPHSMVKRTLLNDMPRLAAFFGRQKTADVLLPRLITVMNDRHWEVRAGFFHNIVGVGACVGSATLESFVLPLFLEGLTDEEEFVVEQAVNALSILAEAGLFKKHTLIDNSERIAPLLAHPNRWIRYAAVSWYAACGRQLSSPDACAFITATIVKFLVRPIVNLSTLSLLAALSPPVGRALYDRALKAFVKEAAGRSAAKSPRGASTGQLRDSNKSARPGNSGKSASSAAIGSGKGLPAEVYDVGLSTADEAKLLLLKGYMMESAQALVKRARVRMDDGANAAAPTGTTSGGPASAAVAALSPRTNAARGADEKKELAPYTNLQAQVQSLGARGSGANAKGGAHAGTKRFYSNIPMPPELGTLRRPTGNGVIDEPVSGESLKGWRPKGALVAHLHEHRRAVRSLAVSADNLFFASGSDDGTVKIWDNMRMEKNVSSRAQVTYTAKSSSGGKTPAVTSVTVLENTHSVAAAATDGSLHVFRVEYSLKSDGMVNRYSGQSEIRHLDLSEGPVIDVQHWTNNLGSPLVAVTQAGGVHGWDLRTQKESFSFNVNPSLGFATSFITDPTRTWMVVGTSRGYFSAYDVRFQVPIHSWGYPGGYPIHKLHMYPASKSGAGRPQIFAAAGRAEVSVWDVERRTANHVFRVLSRADREYTAPPAMTARRPPAATDYGVDDLKNRRGPVANGIHALLSPGDASYVLTAGADPIVRYWDLSNVAGSYQVAGADPGDGKPRYSTVSADRVSLHQEIPADSSLGGTTVGSMAARQRRGPVPPPTGHSDMVLDLAAVELPHRMLISSDRQGAIKVWK